MSSKRTKPASRSKASRPTSAGNTQRESFDLYRSGKSVAEIAAQRSLSPTTIESHLCSFIQTGEMDVAEMVPQHKMQPIQNAAESYGTDRLAPLKEVLGDDYSYAEIKAVVSWLKRDA
jgi:ATP-dependent DNA helicase RecQ